MQAALPQEQQAGPAPAGADAMDPTGAGGGTIGTGQVPIPGEQGFSGNEQRQAVEQTQANGGQQPPMGSIQ